MLCCVLVVVNSSVNSSTITEVAGDCPHNHGRISSTASSVTLMQRDVGKEKKHSQSHPFPRGMLGI